MSEEHRKAARAKLATRTKLVADFATRAASAPVEPNDDEIVHILRSIIVGAPNRRHATAEDIARVMLTQYDVGKSWNVRPGEPPADAEKIARVIKGKQSIPDYQRLHRGMLIEAALALQLRSEDSSALIGAIRRPQTSMQQCLDQAFFFQSESEVTLRPVIASPLSLPPYWEGRPSSLPPPPAKEIARRVDHALRHGEHRVVYVHGAPFSAKREILKSVVRELEDGFLVRADGKRLPALGLAAESMSTKVFIDQVFRFFAANIPATDTLRESLDTDGKVAFIRATAKAAPVLFIVADIEPFDADAMIRRLRGDRIGDILQAVVEGHPDTRVLIAGGQSMEGASAVFWRSPALSFRVHASPDEYLRTLRALGPNLAKRFEKYASVLPASPDAPGPNDFFLSALTMRLAIGIFEKSSIDQLSVEAGPLSTALRTNSAADVFQCVWDELLTPMDQLAFGLVAASHDGLQCSTLARLLRAMSGMDSTAGLRAALAAFDISPPAITDWARQLGSFIRVRDDDAEDPSVYFREQIRCLVLKTWMRELSDQARDGLWCIAREAADQARNVQFAGGGDAADTAFSRNLQALHALLSSVDPSEVTTPAPPVDGFSGSFAAINVLPPLSSAAARRPHGRIAYQYAWATLYGVELKGGDRAIDERYGGPATQLAALLAFLRPDRPWEAFGASDPILADSSYPAGMAVAAAVLTPTHQLALLTEISVAALRSERFALLINVLDMAEGLRGQCLRSTEWVRLQRIRLTLGLLLCGNPAVKGPVARRTDAKLPTGREHYRLDWAAQAAQSLLDELDKTATNDSDVTIARGKLHMRIGEIRHWQGRRGAAGLAFLRGLKLEILLAAEGPLDNLSITPGRGIRSAIRYLLARSTTYQSLHFPDGLAWPMIAPLKDEATLPAITLFAEINKRRARAGGLRELLLAKLEDARIALHAGSLEAAVRDVALATKLAEHGGGAFEIVLELDELRVAILTEAIMQASAANALNHERAEDLLGDLESALGQLKKLTQTALGECIGLNAAAHAEIAFSRLKGHASPESRLHLVNAKDLIVTAMEAANEHGVELFLPRLRLSKIGIESALAGSHSP